MTNTSNGSNTCFAIGLIIAAVIVGIISYYIAQSAPLWMAVVAFLVLLGLGYWLVQVLCSGKNGATAEDMPAPIPEPSPAPVPASVPTSIDDTPTSETKPEMLSAARGGKGDDLKKIKGVGPKMEKMLNGMGFHHFDQIAGWSAQEIAWVDENLQGFKGRVSRDNWADQAKTLAAGGDTAFSKKVDKGGVY
ncbi:MAG: NADH:ubiquinone oxidoreductase [Paracoccaceae bacterium]